MHTGRPECIHGPMLVHGEHRCETPPGTSSNGGLDTLAVTSENLWGVDGTPVEQGRKTNGNAARESVAVS